MAENFFSRVGEELSAMEKKFHGGELLLQGGGKKFSVMEKTFHGGELLLQGGGKKFSVMEKKLSAMEKQLHGGELLFHGGELRPPAVRLDESFAGLAGAAASRTLNDVVSRILELPGKRNHALAREHAGQARAALDSLPSDAARATLAALADASVERCG